MHREGFTELLFRLHHTVIIEPLWACCRRREQWVTIVLFTKMYCLIQHIRKIRFHFKFTNRNYSSFEIILFGLVATGCEVAFITLVDAAGTAAKIIQINT